MVRFLALFLFTYVASFASSPFPIQFSISETKIVKDVPEKFHDFATVIPGDLSTYIFKSETDYYKDYQQSYFGVTRCKAGWDCMRHYEILANGCIPYFIDLDQCDSNTMPFLPKDLIQEAMNLEGVSYLTIDHDKFNLAKYYDLLNRILDHTRNHLSSRQMAKYMLQKINYRGSGKILFLSGSRDPDYLRCTILIGLKELLGERVVDFPKIEHIYKGYLGEPAALYGRGFSYTNVVEDLSLDRSQIKKRIREREFDLIVYGSYHRGLLFHDLVQHVYTPDQIVYLCGEDFHKCVHPNYKNFFLREFRGNQ